MTAEYTKLSFAQQNAVKIACASIAPQWPLDKAIAVSPYWKFRGFPIEDATARLAYVTGIKPLMDKGYYEKCLQEGLISETALSDAMREFGIDESLEQLLHNMDEDSATAVLMTVPALFDTSRDVHKMSWQDEMIYQISQVCADFVKQSINCEKPDALYQYWRQQAMHDVGLSIITDEPSLPGLFACLPDSSEEMLARTFHLLGLNITQIDDYALSNLFSLNGWASYFSYVAWQADLQGKRANQLQSLLAIRAAWDWVIWQFSQRCEPDMFSMLSERWRTQWQSAYAGQLQVQSQLTPRWLFQRAAELTWQRQLETQLVSKKQAIHGRPYLQAVFCIDVRSERYRRFLEQQSTEIKTAGFAGFFGVPAAYQPAGTAVMRPHLPGLLAPSLKVSEILPPDQEQRRYNALLKKAALKTWNQSGASGFAMVETMGWLYALRLCLNNLCLLQQRRVEQQSEANDWDIMANRHRLTLEQKTDIAKQALDALQITTFPTILMLVGHASETANNPHSATLDCGACGGQSGEVSVRVLASLLNDKDIREVLKQRGISIPAETQVVAALHNTTTHKLKMLSEFSDAKVLRWLHQASELTSRDAAPDLPGTRQSGNIAAQLQQRARDWSQVRPEWGLANNAAFIVAPRHLTRGKNLQGRVFLHDYCPELDSQGDLLRQLLTAPMLVTHWINMQYNASVTDNYKLGAGNKVLHNVVGDGLGVFEGNGGDLRIGLSRQSVHDGQRWMHQPLRLSVYVHSPAERLLNVVEQAEDVRQLIDNQWLYLYQWDGEHQFKRLLNGQLLSYGELRSYA